MLVRELMHKELAAILPTSTIYEAAVRMKKDKIGSVLIVDEGGGLKGIVTDRDLALAVAADRRDPNSTFISEIMTADPVTIKTDDSIEHALRIMRKENVRRLPVIENGKLSGILSSADIAVELKEEFDNFIELEEVFAKH